jgi:hypothetical protein
MKKIRADAAKIQLELAPVFISSRILIYSVVNGSGGFCDN